MVQVSTQARGREQCRAGVPPAPVPDPLSLPDRACTDRFAIAKPAEVLGQVFAPGIVLFGSFWRHFKQIVSRSFGTCG